MLPSIARAQNENCLNCIKITEGGTYSGSWDNFGTPAGPWYPENPNNPLVRFTPAVTIDTPEPVTLDGCNVRGYGDLIFAHEGSNVTVKNCTGYSYFSNIEGQPKGHFFKSYRAKYVHIHNNYLEGTTGIRIMEYPSGERSPDEAVVVRFNVAKNIDGRVAYGADNQPSFENVRDGSIISANFVQLMGVKDVPNVEISWNQVINEPGNSRTEDVINIFNSRGTPASPIRIAANYIKGSYAPVPVPKLPDPEKDDFSGGGIMCGDGPHNNPAEFSAYIDCDWNQVVNASNYGMAIAKGHDIIMRNNRIVSSGMIGDKKIYESWLGAYIWNMYDERYLESESGRKEVADCTAGYDNDNTDTWYNNGAYSNYIGGMHNIEDKEGNRFDYRSDWLFCDADQSLTYGNIHWEPELGDITSAMEDEEWNVWQNKLSTLNIQIGPLPQE